MKLLIHLSILMSTVLFVYQKDINDIHHSFNDYKDTLLPPSIVSPFDNIYLQEDTCMMSWTSCGENVSYEIMLSKSYNFDIAATATSKDTTLKKGFKSSEYGTYYWKVRAKNKKTVSAWSAAYRFNVGIKQIQIDNYRGCNGNCGSCSHPCGRRRVPDYYEKIEIKETINK